MLNIITVDTFITFRPDMEIHKRESIQSAINQSEVMLDSECAGLMSKVWVFNQADIPDIKNELFRTRWELSQITEAVIAQTQYMLNMGNDLSVGGGSFSIGNINSSSSRPLDRPAIAPGVFKLLQNARVYFLIDFTKKPNKVCEQKRKQSLTEQVIQVGDTQWVKQYQPEAKVGNVAYVGQNNIVSWGSPQDLNITTYNTQKIAGGQGFTKTFYNIDQVPNIAFFGNDLDGAYSAVHRGEIKQMLENLGPIAPPEGGGEVADYQGVEPIQVNNANRQISLKTEFINKVNKNTTDIQELKNAPEIDTSNFAKLNEPNLYVNTNTFTGEVAFNRRIRFNSPTGDNVPTSVAYNFMNGKLVAVNDDATNITTDNQLPTKKYVDDAVAKVSGGTDLANVAKLNAQNIFEEQNVFKKEVDFQANVDFNPPNGQIRMYEGTNIWFYNADVPENNQLVPTQKWVKKILGKYLQIKQLDTFYPNLPMGLSANVAHNTLSYSLFMISGSFSYLGSKYSFHTNTMCLDPLEKTDMYYDCWNNNKKTIMKMSYSGTESKFHIQFFFEENGSLKPLFQGTTNQPTNISLTLFGWMRFIPSGTEN